MPRADKQDDIYSTCWAEAKAETVTDVYKHFFPMAAGLEDACVEGNKYVYSDCRDALDGYTVAFFDGETTPEIIAVGTGKVGRPSCCPKCVIDVDLLLDECVPGNDGKKGCNTAYDIGVSYFDDDQGIDIFRCCPKYK
eukprot:scaffold243052_cov41-Attheya_sp.AAC.1